MRRFFAFITLCAACASTTGVAFARPVVALELNVERIQTDANGKDVPSPATGSPVHPGDRLRYEIVATNGGDRPALDVRPADAIPAGTAFIAGSATGEGKVEYALDRGTSWSSTPTVVVHAKDGDKIVPADPATYGAIRWTTALKPGASRTFAFEVRVK
jgi:uncharacterized repeat protein (TIGR01451 family)